MSIGKRLRREIKHINRSMKREAGRWGQDVVWYEFDPSSVDDVTDEDLYDEGWTQARAGTSDVGSAGRKWKVGRTVRCYMARVEEGVSQHGPEGEYTVDKLTVIVNAQMLLDSGISRPTDKGAHTLDRIEYDGRLFSVHHFDTQGRIADVHLTITVHANEVKDDERQNDRADWHA